MEEISVSLSAVMPIGGFSSRKSLQADKAVRTSNPKSIFLMILIILFASRAKS
jgi:hypothetical protein